MVEWEEPKAATSLAILDWFTISGGPADDASELKPAAAVPAIGIVAKATANLLFFRQPSAPILGVPGQPGYGDKQPLQ